MITSQNVSYEAQANTFFHFIEKFCYILKIFRFLYFKWINDLSNLWRHDEY